MNRLRVVLENLFQTSSEDSSADEGRIRRELKGSIFTLFALFQLVAVTSYLPIDSFNIFLGRLDHMNNLGGIVGAAVAEIFMGSCGIIGYAGVLITAWLAWCAFRGMTLKQNSFRILGAVTATALAAITCHLFLHDSFPEVSLFQGGYIGVYAGKFLQRYFNTTGALIMVSGGFLLTSIMTIGFSLTRTAGSLFGQDEEEEKNDEEEDSRPAKVAMPIARQVVPVKAPVKPKAKRSRKKKTDGETDGASVEENSEQGEAEQANPSEGEEAPVDGESENKEFVFQDLIPWNGSYAYPSLRLLKSHNAGAKRLSRGEAKAIARKLCEHLLSFQITGEIVACTQGPVLTTFEYKPTAGVKLSKIAALQEDLGIILGTRELRIIAPIPGKTVVGIEVPREKPEVISLKDVLGEEEFADKKLKLPFTLGKATDGTPVFADMVAAPHMLVAGATGSGKSVFINSLIMSFLFRCSPQQLRLILIDPKMLELNVFDGLPHLVSNVITDNNIAYNALSWAVLEMDRRYNLMAETNSKNIDSYNSKQRNPAAKLPFIVIVVDELADLMLSGGEAVEIAITRLAQKARAAGIHLVIATQRPSTDVITGLIKANIPSRLSFKVPSGIDSRTVLDSSGAEELIGRGDSLIVQPGAPLRRLHGCYVSEEELQRVVKFAKDGRKHDDYYIDFSGGSIPKKKK